MFTFLNNTFMGEFFTEMLDTLQIENMFFLIQVIIISFGGTVLF